jgi:hypothetical protein
MARQGKVKRLVALGCIASHQYPHLHWFLEWHLFFSASLFSPLFSSVGSLAVVGGQAEGRDLFFAPRGVWKDGMERLMTE